MAKVIVFEVKIDSIRVMKLNDVDYLHVEFDEAIINDIVKKRLETNELVYEEGTLNYRFLDGYLVVSGKAHISKGDFFFTHS